MTDREVALAARLLRRLMDEGYLFIGYEFDPPRLCSSPYEMGPLELDSSTLDMLRNLAASVDRRNPT